MDQAYEKPETPDLVVKTVECTVEESMLQVVELLEEHVSEAYLCKNFIQVKGKQRITVNYAFYRELFLQLCVHLIW